MNSTTISNTTTFAPIGAIPCDRCAHIHNPYCGKVCPCSCHGSFAGDMFRVTC